MTVRNAVYPQPRPARRCALAASILLLVAACATDSSDPRAAALEAPNRAAFFAVDDAGRAVELSGAARRIVSLVPSATETLVALGVGDRLVGRTDHDDHPDIGALPSVGGGLTPSLERITALRPDLVIVWEEAGNARLRNRLESLGIPVVATQTRDTADILSGIDRLGRLTGERGAADSLAAALRTGFAAVARSVADHPRPTVLYLVGLDPPIVAGPSLYIGELIGIAGGQNVFPEISEASPQISVEEIVRRRPELVLVPTDPSGGDVVARLIAQPGWSELARSGSTRYATVPVNLVHRPGPGLVQAARVLRDAIHPAAEADL